MTVVKPQTTIGSAQGATSRKSVDPQKSSQSIRGTTNFDGCGDGSGRLGNEVKKMLTGINSANICRVTPDNLSELLDANAVFTVIYTDGVKVTIADYRYDEKSALFTRLDNSSTDDNAILKKTLTLENFKKFFLISGFLVTTNAKPLDHHD